MTMHSILWLDSHSSPKQNEKSFMPVTHYSRSSDQLKVFWTGDEASSDEISERPHILVLRSIQASKLITGAKIGSLSEIVPSLRHKLTVPDRSFDEDPVLFRPYAGYEDGKHIDALLVRWQAGKVVESRTAGPRPMILLRDATDQELILGLIVPGISAIARR